MPVVADHLRDVNCRVAGHHGALLKLASDKIRISTRLGGLLHDFGITRKCTEYHPRKRRGERVLLGIERKGADEHRLLVRTELTVVPRPHSKSVV